MLLADLAPAERPLARRPSRNGTDREVRADIASPGGVDGRLPEVDPRSVDATERFRLEHRTRGAAQSAGARKLEDCAQPVADGFRFKPRRDHFLRHPGVLKPLPLAMQADVQQPVRGDAAKRPGKDAIVENLQALERHQPAKGFRVNVSSQQPAEHGLPHPGNPERHARRGAGNVRAAIGGFRTGIGGSFGVQVKKSQQRRKRRPGHAAGLRGERRDARRQAWRQRRRGWRRGQRRREAGGSRRGRNLEQRRLARGSPEGRIRTPDRGGLGDASLSDFPRDLRVTERPLGRTLLEIKPGHAQSSPRSVARLCSSFRFPRRAVKLFAPAGGAPRATIVAKKSPRGRARRQAGAARFAVGRRVGQRRSEAPLENRAGRDKIPARANWPPAGFDVGFERGSIAQRLEHPPFKRLVLGSNPSRPTILPAPLGRFGPLIGGLPTRLFPRQRS